MRSSVGDGAALLRKRAASIGGRGPAPLLILAILTVSVFGCARAPYGPPFELMAQPPEYRGRLYVFRDDDRSSLSKVRVTVGGRELGSFRNGEYETIELPVGTHPLRAGLRSIALVAWGWSNQKLRLRPGETVFIKLSVRLTERPSPGGRELEIAGRPSGAASENVYIQYLSETEGLEQIRTTTRLVPPEAGGG